MKNFGRGVCVGLVLLAAVLGMRGVSQGPAAPVVGAGTVGAARAIAFEGMAVRTMANGGESRDIAHGTLATGETVNLHQSMQVVGAVANAPHVIQHSEFILVREGELEFDHEVDGQMVAEKVGPGGASMWRMGRGIR
jgi:hypothetical protein